MIHADEGENGIPDVAEDSPPEPYPQTAASTVRTAATIIAEMDTSRMPLAQRTSSTALLVVCHPGAMI